MSIVETIKQFTAGMVIALVAVVGGRADAETEAAGGSAQRRVMAFYYPWYGTPDGPGGAGRIVHWDRIDVEKKDIAASTHYPALGAYDSHDEKVIDQHCRWAKRAGIDTLIVSWWGHGSYCDRAMDEILDVCGRHGLKACIYYETVPNPQTAESAANDIIRVLRKNGGHPAHLKVAGKPVVFVYGRAVQEIGLAGWFEAIEAITERYQGGATFIGDEFSYGAARVFDGVHTYNTAGSLRGMTPDQVQKWAPRTYESWVALADRAGKISTLTVIPGYDDTKIRKPGLAVKRYDGDLYRRQWAAAIKADPQWILITSFNEWHEGSEIEPSYEYGETCLNITAQYAKEFKSRPRLERPQAGISALSADEKERLRGKLEGSRIGVLSGADSKAFWWLRDVGLDTKILSWEDVADGVCPGEYPALLYCGGERYRRTVKEAGDVDDALAAYLKAGGALAVLPSLPWPFYYDQDGKVVNQGERFGVTIRDGWEQPPSGAKLTFVQPERRFAHVPEKFDFPASGDLRWRPIWAGGQAKYASLLQLRDGEGKGLGDAVAYAELKDGGKMIYAWFALLDGEYGEALLYDVFDYIAGRLGK
ncbi:MAG: hypothetical protein JXN61_02670 [Sedimentisphaerales bacterium]|nr:hypothetical protein [Sedimentisphaerales bacterium]